VLFPSVAGTDYSHDDFGWPKGLAGRWCSKQAQGLSGSG
jgi:hypothetical protein